MDRSGFSIQDHDTDDLAGPDAIRLPLVTFVITSGTAPEFGSMISAIRAQHYPRCEAVLVEIGDTDDARESLKRQIDGDPRFRTVADNRDLGPFDLTKLGLDAASGEFVVFLQATELPSPDLAAVHVQAHLASRHNVAFTASGRFEAPPTATDWLQPGVPIVRLACLDEDGFAQLAVSASLVEPTAQGWTTSPDAIRMYRRFVLDGLHPLPGISGVQPASAAAHYAPLCQWLGGSIAIALSLSTGLAGSGPEAGVTAAEAIRSVEGDRHKLGVWAAHGADFSRRIGPARYWDAFAAMLGLAPDGATAPGPQEIAARVDGILPLLTGALGEKQAIQKLDDLLPRPALMAILRNQHGRRLPLRVEWALRSAPLSQMHEGIRGYLRARRKRRSRSRAGIS